MISMLSYCNKNNYYDINDVFIALRHLIAIKNNYYYANHDACFYCTKTSYGNKKNCYNINEASSAITALAYTLQAPRS